MNIFNRIVMVILMLCLVVVSIVAIVNVFANLFEWSSVADRIINYASSINPYILAAILFLVLVVALLILIFEFYRKRVKVANVSSDQSGKTMVTLKTVSSQITEKLIGIEGSQDPKVRIIPMREGIIIDITSKLMKGVNVTEKTKEIRDKASEFASKDLGFKVMKSNYTAVGFVEGRVKDFNEIRTQPPEPEIIKSEEILESKDPTKPNEPTDIRSVEDDNN